MGQYCRSCGSPVRAGAKFCPACGRPVELPRCAACGAALKPTSRFCPACGLAVGALVPAAAPAPPPPAKRRRGKRAALTAAVALVVAAAVAFTGLVTPGWMKGSKDGITLLDGRGSYVELALPAQDPAVESTLAVASMALRAQASAMLTEEAFYRAVDRGQSPAQLTALLEQNEAAWAAADVLSSATYQMCAGLHRAQAGEKGSVPTAAFVDPFVISASAADPLHMDRFDDAKEWAEYITQIVDHAKTDKTAYLARLLKTDVNRANAAIAMSQAILGGAGEAQAYNDSATLTALQTTKATGKAAGFVAATIATGGTSMGVLSAGGFVAGGVDTFIEVADTGLRLTLGEDHKCTKLFQEQSGKLAPVIAVASLTNLSSWATGADKVGNLRYIVDSVMDLTKGKVLGFDCTSTPESGKVKLLTLPAGKELTPEELEQAAKALGAMGFDPEAVKEALTPAQKEPEAAELPFSDLSDEKLAELIGQLSLTELDWEDLFRTLYEEFCEEIAGMLPAGDEFWDYDPFLPPADLPQPEEWEQWSGAQPEPAASGSENAFESVEDVASYKGKYAGTCNVTEYYTGGSTPTQEEKDSVMVRIADGGIAQPWNFGHGQKFDEGSIHWDAASASGTATANDGHYEVAWHFEVSGQTIRLLIDVYEPKPAWVDQESAYLTESHYELVKIES